MPSPNRKAAKAYLTPEEYGQVSAMAKQAGLSVSTFVKRVSLGERVRSKEDQQTIIALHKANADFGRVGGLLKLALSSGQSGVLTFECRGLLRQIEKSQAEVMQICRSMAEKE